MPLFFDKGWEPKQLKQIFAHHQIGIKRNRLADRGQCGKCAIRTIDHVPDPTHIQQDVIVRAIINTSRELTDHSAFANAASQAPEERA